MRSIFRRVSYALILVFVTQSAFAQTRVISTVAGTGTAGFSGDGGPATAAQLNGPSEITIDGKGSFFIADRDNHRIRKVDGATGVITTVVGNGVAGWFFEGGPAKLASLDHPSGVEIDAAGNLYIADLLDNGITRIHKVTASNGLIARIDPIVLKGAVAIALDSDGNLYIAEEIGHRIRKMSLSAGTLTTVAGTGAPGFSGDGGPATSAAINAPVHLAIDGDGNLYFSDSLNNRIRKVTAATGIITTVAGSGATGGPGGFSGDGGLATAAQLNNPRGVDVDASGNILIADTMNKRIRKVNASTGLITTIVAGNLTGIDCDAASSALESPQSVAVNAAGNFIYVADDNGNRIFKVALDLDNPPPALTSIDPASGLTGTTVTTTLTGSGFLGGTAETQSAGCRFNGTTVGISGTGVSVAAANITSNTEIAATLVVAPNAAPGPRDVTVITDGGTTTAVQFTVTVPPVPPPPPPPPPPTITSITPASGVRGSTATVSLTGTNFDGRPNFMALFVDSIPFKDLRVIDTSSLTVTFAVPADTGIGEHTVSLETLGGPSNVVVFTVEPQGPSFVYGIPQMLNPTDQTPIQVELANPIPDAVTGKLTLTFLPNAVNPTDDPNVMFINSQASTRTVDVTFPANTSTAELSLPAGVLQAGTVAGTIELSMGEVAVAGLPVQPTGTDFAVQVPLGVPVITNVRILNRDSKGFDVEVTGYSTSREIAASTFKFEAASGANLLTLQLQPAVVSTFTTYYQSEDSSPVGGSFVYLQPFHIDQGTAKDVAAITVTLSNAQGTSEPKTVQ